ncbi:hypothetical protein FI667_g10999, partial [Globisporangium splendens]
MNSSGLRSPENQIQRRGGRFGGEVVYLVRNLGDVVPPGLNPAIGAVMLLINVICKRLLREQHEAIDRVKSRVDKLLFDVTAMGNKHRYVTTDCAVKYQDVLTRFYQFMAKCEKQNSLVQVFKGS